MSSLHYILAHFFTREQLSTLSGVPESRLSEMQNACCLPGPAYRIEGQGMIHSIFGSHDTPFFLEFYPHSHLAKIEEIEASAEKLVALSATLSATFKTRYRELLVMMQADQFGLAPMFSERGQVEGQAAETLLETEWQHYLKGTYGLCTKHNTVDEIATKEIMIARIKTLVEMMEAGSGVCVHDDLRDAIDRLDQVSSPFAPHERGGSSRGKYIDALRAQYFSDET